MIAIQILLMLAVLGALLVFLRHHGKTKTAASVKVGFVLFLAFGVVAVLLPDMVSAVANFLGVGRGTDLLLYVLIVAFGFATINTYLRFKELEYRYAKLVRAVALQNRRLPEQASDPGTDHIAAAEPATGADGGVVDGVVDAQPRK